MPRIAVDVYALVKNLFTDFRLSTRRRKRTTTFFRTARVKTKSKRAEQIRDCLRLEDHGICSRIERPRITCIECFANCFSGDAGSIEFGNVEMIAEEVT